MAFTLSKVRTRSFEEFISHEEICEELDQFVREGISLAKRKKTIVKKRPKKKEGAGLERDEGEEWAFLSRKGGTLN